MEFGVSQIATVNIQNCLNYKLMPHDRSSEIVPKDFQGPLRMVVTGVAVGEK
jgi:hypothetical protein